MIKWFAPQFLKLTTDEIAKNMVRAGVYFVSKERGFLNVSQPYTRTADGKHRGQDPSAPGDFPKKLSGQLQRSITWTLDRGKLVLTVGSNLGGYPKWLQTSTRFMAARPWLSLGFNREKGSIGKIIVGR